MAEYIEREALKQSIKNSDMWNREKMSALMIVSEEPAADVVPVVHGRWINRTKSVKGLWDYRFDCSACDHIFWSAVIKSFNYCPNCGARMDGE